MNKSVHTLKQEIESIKKTQTERILEMKSLEIRTRTTEAIFTNRRQEMKERLSVTENTIE